MKLLPFAAGFLMHKLLVSFLCVNFFSSTSGFEAELGLAGVSLNS